MCRAGANTCHSLQPQDFNHGHLRSCCHRHRSGRICLRHPPAAPRHEAHLSRHGGNAGKPQTVETKNIVIATGSAIARLKGIAIDEKRIVSSTGALSLDRVPEKLLIVGAGVIGLELGSVWHRLGAQVTVVEFLDHILPGNDAEVAKQFQRILEKQGFAFKLGAKVTAVDTSGKTLIAKIEPAAGGAAEKLETDVVLVSIGRVPYTEGLGLKEAGVALDNRGPVQIDAHFATTVKGVYAIGDVVAGA